MNFMDLHTQFFSTSVSFASVAYPIYSYLAAVKDPDSRLNLKEIIYFSFVILSFNKIFTFLWLFNNTWTMMNNIILNQLALEFNSTTEEYYATTVHKGIF